jgi:hypothetical protein
MKDVFSCALADLRVPWYRDLRGTEQEQFMPSTNTSGSERYALPLRCMSDLSDQRGSSHESILVRD